MSEADQDEIAAGPNPSAPMSAEDRAQFAKELRDKLNSRRDVFVIDKWMFEPQGRGASENRLVSHPEPRVNGGEPQRNIVKNVSAATLKLLLDYCEQPEWTMDFVSYCAGIFHGRAPNPGECAFDLLPDVQSKLNADRLGFGHIYGER